MKTLLLFIVLGLAQVSAIAQGEIDHIRDQPYMKNAAKVDCNNEDAFTTTTARICANLAYQKSDSLLVIVYKKLLVDQDSDSGRNYIIKLQKEWRSFRDKHCNIVWERYKGGSMQASAFLSCLTELTNNRRKELEALLSE
jgi:uncharacterized protein YecT (DUF1311 family)